MGSCLAATSGARHTSTATRESRASSVRQRGSPRPWGCGRTPTRRSSVCSPRPDCTSARHSPSTATTWTCVPASWPCGARSSGSPASCLSTTPRRALRRDAHLLVPRPACPFLLPERGIRVTQCSARYNFAVVSRAVGLRPPTHGGRHRRGPRMHDMRHRLAARTMVRWYREDATWSVSSPSSPGKIQRSALRDPYREGRTQNLNPNCTGHGRLHGGTSRIHREFVRAIGK